MSKYAEYLEPDAASKLRDRALDAMDAECDAFETFHESPMRWAEIPRLSETPKQGRFKQLLKTLHSVEDKNLKQDEIMQLIADADDSGEFAGVPGVVAYLSCMPSHTVANIVTLLVEEMIRRTGPQGLVTYVAHMVGDYFNTENPIMTGAPCILRDDLMEEHLKFLAASEMESTLREIENLPDGTSEKEEE